MIITVAGSGHMGLTVAVCLAKMGHKVYCVDRNARKIQKINNGIPTFYEESLEKLLKQGLRKNSFKATTDLHQAIKISDMSFICVANPCKEDGSIDLSQVKKVATDIGKLLCGIPRHKYHVVTVKSTVIPGTTRKVVIPTLERFSRQEAGVDFGVCTNPEFLREGHAIEDFFSPKDTGIVIGELTTESGDALFELYRGLDSKKLRTDLTTAEMIKYARNCYLAKDISFANELANICQKFGVDFVKVKEGMEMDKRIGKGRFLNAGIGFGGSCLPKDVKALASKAKKVDIQPKMLDATLEINDSQPYIAISFVKQSIKMLRNKRIAILGLSFKPGTNDIREAPSLRIIDKLLKEGAKLKVYDPKALSNVRKTIKDKVFYAQKAHDALVDADVCIIVTEWPEFSNPSLYRNMSGRIIVDGRRILDPKILPPDFVYLAVGYPQTQS